MVDWRQINEAPEANGVGSSRVVVGIRKYPVPFPQIISMSVQLHAGDAHDVWGSFEALVYFSVHYRPKSSSLLLIR